MSSDRCKTCEGLYFVQRYNSKPHEKECLDKPLSWGSGLHQIIGPRFPTVPQTVYGAVLLVLEYSVVLFHVKMDSNLQPFLERHHYFPHFLDVLCPMFPSGKKRSFGYFCEDMLKARDFAGVCVMHPGRSYVLLSALFWICVALLFRPRYRLMWFF